MITNHLEPVLLMILGAIATATDVMVFARDLFKAAREETKSLEAEMHREQASAPRPDAAGRDPE